MAEQNNNEQLVENFFCNSGNFLASVHTVYVKLH